MCVFYFLLQRTSLCRRMDSNHHSIGNLLLRQARLPFRHIGYLSILAVYPVRYLVTERTIPTRHAVNKTFHVVCRKEILFVTRLAKAKAVCLWQSFFYINHRATNGVRTHDLGLGKPTFYQLNYCRISATSRRV